MKVQSTNSCNYGSSCLCEEPRKAFRSDLYSGTMCSTCKAILEIEKSMNTLDQPTNATKQDQQTPYEFIDDCMAKNESLSEILIGLNQKFGLNSDQAAKIYKERIWNRVLTEEEKTYDYPIVSMEFLENTLSYVFTLVTADGILFKIRITADPEKFIQYRKNPIEIMDRSIKLKFRKTDKTNVPIDPVVTGLVSKRKDS